MAKKRIDIMSKTILHVEMFEKRHIVPDYVTDSVFKSRVYGYNPLDCNTFRAEAYERFSRWKAQGVAGVVLYRSGLFPAYDAILNAAWETELYLRPMVFSFMQGVWLPSYLSQFNNFGINNSYTKNEKDLWGKEYNEQSKFPDFDDYRMFVKYARMYGDICVSKKYFDNFDLDKCVRRYSDTFNLKNTHALRYIKDVFNSGGDFYGEFKDRWIAGEFRSRYVESESSKWSTQGKSKKLRLPYKRRS